MIGTQYKEAYTDRKCAFQRCPSNLPHYKAQELHRSMWGDSAQSSHAGSTLQTRTSRCSHWKCQGKAVRRDDFRKTIWGAPSLSLLPAIPFHPPCLPHNVGKIVFGERMALPEVVMGKGSRGPWPWKDIEGSPEGLPYFPLRLSS